MTFFELAEKLIKMYIKGEIGLDSQIEVDRGCRTVDSDPLFIHDEYEVGIDVLIL